MATAEPQPAVSPEDWERLARLSKLASEHEPTAAPLPPPSPSTSPHPPPQPPSPGQQASPARGVVRAADRARWPLRVPTHHGSSPASAATSPTPLAPPASAASPLASPPSRRQPVSVPTHASPPAAASPARPKTGLGALCSSSTSHVLDRIQLLQARNAEGASMIEQCGAIVDLATKRCYTKERDSYFAVTVTDWFGGRGHDFDCLDERANAAGGLLVIATSIPDAREWAQWKGRTARQVTPLCSVVTPLCSVVTPQWKGRTARQDRPGQYLVVLSEEDEPFASEPGLAEVP